MKMKNIVANIKTIFTKIKEIFKFKDKNKIIACIGQLFVIIIIAIIIKVPFLLVNTLLLDFLNSLELSIMIQNIVYIILEIIYILVALIYIYNRLKKLYIK